jgi:predicted MFS family arabinose efflux permease
VPVLLLMSGSGMAAGSWLAGVIYDHYGYYAPAFAAGIGANMLNFLIIGTLVARQQWTLGPPRREVRADVVPQAVP